MALEIRTFFIGPLRKASQSVVSVREGWLSVWQQKQLVFSSPPIGCTPPRSDPPSTYTEHRSTLADLSSHTDAGPAFRTTHAHAPTAVSSPQIHQIHWLNALPRSKT